jgi:DNA-binding Lrp family transcriptional regulator
LQSVNGIDNDKLKFDKIDFKIVTLLVLGYHNKKISSTLKIPLSTIQRRTRIIVLSKIITQEYIPNFKILGIKKGVLHIYLRDGSLKQRAETISKLDGVLSVSIHVGNSDIVAEFVYDNSECLVDIISEIKHMQDIEKVLWSEEIYTVPTSKENILKSFKKYWTENNKNNNHGLIRDIIK